MVSNLAQFTFSVDLDFLKGETRDLLSTVSIGVDPEEEPCIC